MPEQNGATGHPIRVVAQRTGLTAATLRAWERRYDIVVPTRSGGGHRLYSDEDIRRLRALVRAVEGGRSIGQLAGLTTDEVERLVEEDYQERAPEPSIVVASRQDQVAAALELVEAMEADELERFLMRAAVSLRPAEVVSGILVPLLRQVGEAWSGGRLGASSEHVASVTIRRFLEWLTRTVQVDGGGALAVTGTPAGQRHEFGALLAGVIAAGEGWRVRFLGPDLPASEIARAGTALGASLIALSAVHPDLPLATVDDLAGLRRELPDRIDIVIGGHGAAPYRARWAKEGILYFDSLELYQTALTEIRDRRLGALEGAALADVEAP